MPKASGGGERRQESCRSRQDGIAGQHQFQAGDDVHDGQRGQQRHDAGIDDGNGINRADQGTDQDCRGNRRRIAVAELRQARIDGGAEAHIGSQRQVDATGDDIGAPAISTIVNPMASTPEMADWPSTLPILPMLRK